MSALKLDELPEALRSLRAKPLFAMRLMTPAPPLVIGATPGAIRRTIVVTGGEFEGERLSGQVLNGGADRQSLWRDGSVELNVRINLKTDDGALIDMTYRGIRAGTAEVLEKIDKGEAVDPSDYYFRINPMFETAADKYDWLNRVLAIGIGHRLPNEPIYSIFEIL